MSIYCPLAESLGIETTISIIDIDDFYIVEYDFPFTPWNKGKTGIQIPWNKGKTNVYNEKTINKMRKAKLGKDAPNKGKKLGPLPDITKEKIRKSLLGLVRGPREEYHKEKISNTLKEKGIKPPSRKGSKWSEEQRQKFLETKRKNKEKQNALVE